MSPSPSSADEQQSWHLPELCERVELHASLVLGTSWIVRVALSSLIKYEAAE
jgi:hypothetical protein